MAIIANWPNSCPDCGCLEFYASSRIKSALLMPEQRKERYTHGRLKFTCRDQGCGAEWVVDLASVDPLIFISEEKDVPLAIVVGSREEAEAVLALDGPWKVYNLSTLIRAGGERARLVALTASTAKEE